jgi:hypothetical protein
MGQWNNISRSPSCRIDRTSNCYCVMPMFPCWRQSSISQLLIKSVETKIKQCRYDSLVDYYDERVVAVALTNFSFQLLRRMLHMQIDAYGPDDARSVSTGEKITNLLLDKDNESPTPTPQTRAAVQEWPGNAKFRPFSFVRRRNSKAS